MQFIRFAMVGILNTLIDFGVLNGLLWLGGYPVGWQLVLYNVMAFAAANGNSYFLNKQWTFADVRPASLRQLVVFIGLTSIGLVINCLVIYILTVPAWSLPTIPSALWINISKAIATSASMTWNYCSYRLWVFRNNALGTPLTKVKPSIYP